MMKLIPDNTISEGEPAFLKCHQSAHLHAKGTTDEAPEPKW